jgi:hypothetical protein
LPQLIPSQAAVVHQPVERMLMMVATLSFTAKPGEEFRSIERRSGVECAQMTTSMPS